MVLGYLVLNGGLGKRSPTSDYDEDDANARRLDKAHHVGDIVKPAQVVSQGEAMAQHLLQAAIAAAKSPTPATPDQLWNMLATANAGTWNSNQAEMLKSRPAANAQPSDINAWLNQWGASPVYAYPEWRWHFNGRDATASYDLGQDDHVQWSADALGHWSYQHQWGGTSVGQLLDEAVGIVSKVAALGGMWGVALMLQTAQAIADHRPIGDVVEALKTDFNDLQDGSQLAFSVLSGNWEQAWDAATNYGKDMGPLLEAFKGGPAPDRYGQLVLDTPSPLPHPLPPPLAKPLKPGLASISGYSEEGQKGGRNAARGGRQSPRGGKRK